MMDYSTVLCKTSAKTLPGIKSVWMTQTTLCFLVKHKIYFQRKYFSNCAGSHPKRECQGVYLSKNVKDQ